MSLDFVLIPFCIFAILFLLNRENKIELMKELEGDQLEVSTDKCNYVAITFPIVQNVPAGTPVKTLVLHTGLWAPEPGFAHVAWIINDTVFWEENPEIPASTEFYFQESELPFAIGPSDTLHFHLHNHGANDWKIAEFQRTDVD